MKSNRTGSFLWIDFSKAFDSISHDCPLSLLEHIGFSESLINAIMRGSRQKDPISGYLFNIALDVLNHMVLSELSSSLLKVLDSPIPSLMYYDDTVLCFQNSSVIPSALKILDNFAKIYSNTTFELPQREQVPYSRFIFDKNGIVHQSKSFLLSLLSKYHEIRNLRLSPIGMSQFTNSQVPI
eukprot:TRINITY_DN11063_c1_g1_i4.p1 TRINITY_DN11063_c1_g1~~TRINITY_DN11063_c1_g1_i4.p1  ORF type:complete len:182 (+),score=3.05 TRINITY_DN11063_c1_g1_i4:737-1282(+)